MDPDASSRGARVGRRDARLSRGGRLTRPLGDPGARRRRALHLGARTIAAIAANLGAISHAAPARAEPATSEWTYWVGGEFGRRKLGDDTVLVGEGNGGAEVTFGLATFGSDTQYGGPYELRAGPWVGTAFGSRGALVESGCKLHFSQTDHAQWGTYELRVGGGYGTAADVAAPHVVVAAAGGVRSFLGRYRNSHEAVGLGSVLRLVLTARVRPTSASAPWDVVFGVEFEPSIFGPPYSWPRMGGAQP